MHMLINHTKVYRAMRDKTVRAVHGAWRGDGRCLCDIGVSNRSYGGEECCSGREHGISAFYDTSGCPGEGHDTSTSRGTSTFCNPCPFNNALQNANPFHGKSCHDTNNQSKVADPPTTTHTGTGPYTTIEHNKALLRRTLMIEHITMDRKHRYIKTVQEYFDSLVVQYYDALGEWEVERCVGVKREIFKVWGMIRKWNDGVG